MELLLVLVTLSCAGGAPISSQVLEVKKHLKRLNKPAVKSIKVFFFFSFLYLGVSLLDYWFALSVFCFAIFFSLWVIFLICVFSISLFWNWVFSISLLFELFLVF